MNELSVRLDRSDILRALGYRRAKGPSASVEARLAGLRQEALSLLDPKGAWRVISGSSASGAGMPGPAESVGIGLVTAGPALEEEVRRRGELGAPLEALLLDAVGSVAAEAAADALNAELCAEAGRRGLFAATRKSPGYGKWDVARQKDLLDLLPAAELGIRLTPGGMMVPRKSVSFALNFLGLTPPGRSRGTRCTRCGLSHCPYKQE